MPWRAKVAVALAPLWVLSPIVDAVARPKGQSLRTLVMETVVPAFAAS